MSGALREWATRVIGTGSGSATSSSASVRLVQRVEAIYKVATLGAAP